MYVCLLIENDMLECLQDAVSISSYRLKEKMGGEGGGGEEDGSTSNLHCKKLTGLCLQLREQRVQCNYM